MSATPVWLFLHVIGVSIWVGGMFFAYFCLRPPAAAQLDPPQRLQLWAAVFSRFFPAVWASIVAISASGTAMLSMAGFRGAPAHWHLMLGLGLGMMAIFGHVYFAGYARLRRGVEVSDWKAAGAALNGIRRLVGINLSLGIVTIAVGTLGRLFA